MRGVDDSNDADTLGTYPTPIERLPLSNSSCEVWVKRDDQTNARYGGNKVRKLERILADAKARGAERLVTIGAGGSHHVLATTIFGRAHGFTVEAVLVPQIDSIDAQENLRAGLAAGLVAHAEASWASVPFRVASRLNSKSYFITVGGSSTRGALGYVDAAFELASQIRNGEMPEPDLIVAALGSGGTVAGLAAGVMLAGLRSRVLAVTVSDPPFALPPIARALARSCIASRDRLLPYAEVHDRIVEERRFLGGGYSVPTRDAEEATRVARDFGLTLESTYTGKAFAAVLDAVREKRAKRILFFQTLSSAPMSELLRDAPDLPPKLRALFRAPRV